VLVIKDPPTLAARLEEVFASKPLAELGKNASGKCPPPPPGFADPASTPAPAVTPPADAPTPAP
jgi:hypothetical protein